MRHIFTAEPRREYLAATADAALNIGHRFAGKPDTANRYYLTAAFLSYYYLQMLDKPESEPYNALRIQMIQIYNQAVMELFSYLRHHQLYRKQTFSLATAMGPTVNFTAPEYHLPLPPEDYTDFQLCADYETRNLTHTSSHFGFGVPLICEVKPESGKSGTHFAADQMLPATLLIKFDVNKDFSRINAGLIFLNSRDITTFKLGKYQIPLAMDFSTPVAYMSKKPLKFDIFDYMIYPEKSRDIQGLYLFEPFNPDRIPVVLVHGLMSNTRTWLQMLNTLQNDPQLRRHYQFWGFSYSSGNPVLHSAHLLRKALLAKRAELVACGVSTRQFDRMVLVGHSMGGLLSKTAIMDTKGKLLDTLLADRNIKLSPEQRKFLADNGLEFSHLPFVRRVIFIAVPHGGADMATSFVGRLGSHFIKLPRRMIREIGVIAAKILPGTKFRIATGIDNLSPQDRILPALKQTAFVPGVPFHSIIGNRKAAGVPGGDDGVVPYHSSHLDGAASELIVKSDHSAQQNPLGIQEVRRILLEHLRSFADLHVETPDFATGGNKK